MSLQPFFIPPHLPQLEAQGLTAPPTALTQLATGLMQSSHMHTGAPESWQQRALAAWHTVARLWENWAFAEAEELLDKLALSTRMSRAVLRESVANHFRALTLADMHAWLLEVHETRAENPAAQSYPPLAFVVSAGNLPGVAIQPVVQLSLLGVPALIKCASAEPDLMPALLSTLAQQDAEVASRLAALHWPRAQHMATQAVLQTSPALVALGDDVTVAELKTLAPRDYVPMGDRFSLAVVRAATVRPQTLRQLAYDYFMFDGKGCLAPQAVLVIADSWQQFENLAMHFAGILAEEAMRWPAGAWSAAEKAVLQQWRGEWRAQRAASERVALYEPGDTSWTLVAADDCDLSQRVAWRVVRLCWLGSLQEAMNVLRNYSGKVQALAVELEDEEHAQLVLDLEEDDELLGRIICAPGHLQRPPFAWMDVNKAWFAFTRGLDLSALPSAG